MVVADFELGGSGEIFFFLGRPEEPFFMVGIIGDICSSPELSLSLIVRRDRVCIFLLLLEFTGFVFEPERPGI